MICSQPTRVGKFLEEVSQRLISVRWCEVEVGVYSNMAPRLIK